VSTNAGPPTDHLPDALGRDNFIVHSERPLALKVKRAHVGMGPITSLSLVFVRNNLPMPDASILTERDAWQLQVSGLPNPRKISIAALKRLPSAPSP
jgi:sulfite oxidase